MKRYITTVILLSLLLSGCSIAGAQETEGSTAYSTTSATESTAVQETAATVQTQPPTEAVTEAATEPATITEYLPVSSTVWDMNGELVKHTELVHDGQGNLLSSRVTDAAGNTTELVELSLDEQGRTLTQRTTDENGEEILFVSYVYSEDMIETVYSMPKTAIDYGVEITEDQYTVTYREYLDDLGRTIKKEQYTWEMLITTTCYTYNDQGWEIQCVEDYDGSGYVQTTDTEYDEHGNRVFVRITRTGDIEFEVIARYEHTYDAEGKLIGSASYDGDGTLMSTLEMVQTDSTVVVTQIKYKDGYEEIITETRELDENGNSIRQIREEDGAVVSITENEYMQFTRPANAGHS